MLDMQLLAFQSDLTRVVSFMIGKEQSARPYPQIGVPEAHHPLSHHGNVPELVAHMSKINRYHTELFAQYLEKLRATPDGDGSLLDHLMILYGSGISNSTRHAGDNLPLLLVGGGSGAIGRGPTPRLYGRTIDGQSAGDADGQARGTSRAGSAEARGPSHSRRSPEYEATMTRSLIDWRRLAASGLALLILGTSAEAQSPLIDAVRNMDGAAARALLQQGANVDATESRRYDGVAVGKLSR